MSRQRDAYKIFAKHVLPAMDAVGIRSWRVSQRTPDRSDIDIDFIEGCARVTETNPGWIMIEHSLGVSGTDLIGESHRVYYRGRADECDEWVRNVFIPHLFPDYESAPEPGHLAPGLTKDAMSTSDLEAPSDPEVPRRKFGCKEAIEITALLFFALVLIAMVDAAMGRGASTGFIMLSALGIAADAGLMAAIIIDLSYKFFACCRCLEPVFCDL